MGNNISNSECKTDADCYKAGATDADKAKTCCARNEILKLDASKPNHATYMAAYTASASKPTSGFKDGKVGEVIMQCTDDYPTHFSATNFKDNETIDTGALP